MASYRYLVVGGGMTGDAACKGIRSIDPDGAIALVGEEPDPPYARPPLTKGLWLGKEESSIWRGTEDEGVDLAHKIWANAGLPGELAQVLPSPRHFEQASQLVTRESTASSVSAGPDPQVHIDAVREYIDLGYDEVYVANMGPHYRDMIALFGKEVLPELRSR